MESAAPGRHETPEERADRNWVDLMQEVRVAQTGVQLLAGFLVTLPFQRRFGELDDFQRGVYVALLGLALTTVAVMIAPVAIHRRSFGQRAKPRTVRAGHLLIRSALLLVILLLSGIFFFVLDVLLDRTVALGAAAGGLVLLTGLLVVLPRWVASGPSVQQWASRGSNPEPAD